VGAHRGAANGIFGGAFINFEMVKKRACPFSD
jgi:hypothetical protein